MPSDVAVLAEELVKTYPGNVRALDEKELARRADIERNRGVVHIRPAVPVDIGSPRFQVRPAGLTDADRYLIVNPFFHTFGYKAGILACLMRGATNYPLAVFDAGVVLEIVERERITVLPGPPTIYHSLLEHPDTARRDISSLRVGVTGAADIPVIATSGFLSRLDEARS